MSIKIAKIKNYIKETYEKLGDIIYSDYWNLGYINALMDKEIISKIEAGALINHNDKIYFVEKMKILNRKIEIKEEELNKMELEKIKKRIDGSIRKCSTVSSDICTADIVEKIREGHTALCMYKELIQGIEEIRNPVYNIENLIRELEDKYYPKPKTIQEKINDIINKNYLNENYVNKTLNRQAIYDDLIKLRDGMED